MRSRLYTDVCVRSLLLQLGNSADELGLEKRMRPGSRKRPAYSRLILARLILTLESCRGSLIEVIASVGAINQWVASRHDALFAG